MNCPKCTTELSAIVYEQTPVHTCSSCGGEFLTGDALGEIVRRRDETFCDALRESLEDATPFHGVPSEESECFTDCPQCAKPMTVVNYSNDSGVFVDRCNSCHGMWLDRDELEQIQILMEQWAQSANEQIKAIAGELEMARRSAAAEAGPAFQGSRFAFVNALINRLVDAA